MHLYPDTYRFKATKIHDPHLTVAFLCSWFYITTGTPQTFLSSLVGLEAVNIHVSYLFASYNVYSDMSSCIMRAGEESERISLTEQACICNTDHAELD